MKSFRAMRPFSRLLLAVANSAIGLHLSACDPAETTYALGPLIDRPAGSAEVNSLPPNGLVTVEEDATDAPEVKREPIIQKGSGNLGGETDLYDFSEIEAPQYEDAPGEEGTEGLTLNFVDVDVKEVVKAVLGDILGKSYSIDPALAFKMTLRTNKPIPKEALLPTLEDVLAMNDVVIVEGAEGYDVRAKGNSSVTSIRTRQQPGYGSEIVPVNNIAPSELAKILEKYADGGAVRVVDDARGLLIVAGTGPDRQRLVEIAGLFDVDSMQGLSFGLFPIEVADPAAVAQELGQVFVPEAGSLSRGGVLQVTPISRLNSLLVVASDANDLDRVRVWIERLDRAVEKDEPQLYVHYLQNGEAKNVAAVLSDIFGDSGRSKSEAKASAAIAPGFTPYTMSSKGTEGPVQQEGGAQPTAYESASDGPLSAVAAGGEAAAQANVTTTTISSKALSEYGVKVTADENNNSLFIFATPRDYRIVKAALAHLDIEPLQVLIEATIAEVTLNDELRYGVEWFFKNKNSSWTLVGNTAGIPTPVFPGFSYALALSDVNVVLNALDKVTNVNVISAPQIMVLDNRTAALQVGDQVPVITQSAVSVTDPDAPIVNAVEYWDTGVILTVTPRVSSGGAVQLQIEQEVSDVVTTTTSTIDSPTIQQRKMKSSVSVRDGSTIALGGLIRDKVTTGKSGIPVLVDIPVLGNLFGTTSENSTRTELLVLLTPHVVRNQEDAQEVTEELKNALKALKPLGGKVGNDPL